MFGTPLASAGDRSVKEERSFWPSTFVGPPLQAFNQSRPIGRVDITDATVSHDYQTRSNYVGTDAVFAQETI